MTTTLSRRAFTPCFAIPDKSKKALRRPLPNSKEITLRLSGKPRILQSNEIDY